MDIIYRTFMPQMTKTEGGNYRVAITTSTKDRQGQIIKADGGQFGNYMRNPVVMYAHRYDGLPVGKTITITPGANSVDAEFTFAPPGVYDLADTVHRLWDAGLLNAVSVGIVPLEWEDKETISKWELLEFSIVPVPANQEALRRILDVDDDIEQKEGRVLSKKNRMLIMDAVKQMKACVQSLQALLRATEPQSRDDEPDTADDNEPGDDEKDKRDKLMADIVAGLSRIREAYHG